MAAVAAVAVVAIVVIVVVVLPRLGGGHDAHSGGAADATSPSAEGSSLLRLGAVGLLFGGWALAFTVGIWRRWRITDHVRSDYDSVSARG